MKVFKYPWEKGRLARIFGSESLVKIPKLKPKAGGVDPVHVEVAVGEFGALFAAVLQPHAHDGSVFSQVVKKVEDVGMVEDKSQKRLDAVKSFWELLSFSLKYTYMNICTYTHGFKKHQPSSRCAPIEATCPLRKLPLRHSPLMVYNSNFGTKREVISKAMSYKVPVKYAHQKSSLFDRIF